MQNKQQSNKHTSPLAKHLTQQLAFPWKPGNMNRIPHKYKSRTGQPKRPTCVYTKNNNNTVLLTSPSSQKTSLLILTHSSTHFQRHSPTVHTFHRMPTATHLPFSFNQQYGEIPTGAIFTPSSFPHAKTMTCERYKVEFGTQRAPPTPHPQLVKTLSSQNKPTSSQTTQNAYKQKAPNVVSFVASG